MADEKKTRAPRRSKTDLIQAKLDKAISDKEKYTAKITELDSTIKDLQQQLEASKIDLIAESLQANNLTVSEALEALAKAGEAKKNAE